MRITQWGEYGIHCSVFIASRHQDGLSAVGASEIARSQEIALGYAQQILQRLRVGKIIESVRGPQGGYRLLRPAEEVTLYDVIVAAEGNTLEVMCDSKPLSPERCGEDVPCCLRLFWYDLREHVNSFLKSSSLADLVERSREMDKLIRIGEEPSQKILSDQVS